MTAQTEQVAKCRKAQSRGIGPRVIGLICAGALVAAVAACAPVVRQHGYVPAEHEMAQIQIGKDTRDSVAAKIGRPSAQGLLNDVGWFYVQSRFQHLGPVAPKEISREVLVVNFSPAGVVSNIGRYGIEDGRVVELSRRVTESNIKGVTFIGQLLGNVGRINATDILTD